MKFVAALAGALVIAFIVACLVTWPVMVLLGVLASMTGWPIAIGFWPSFVIVIIARLLTADASVSTS